MSLTDREMKLLREVTKELFKDWDKVRPTKDCRHCNGTGIAPGDGKTECGFCE